MSGSWTLDGKRTALLCVVPREFTHAPSYYAAILLLRGPDHHARRRADRHAVLEIGSKERLLTTARTGDLVKGVPVHDVPSRPLVEPDVVARQVEHAAVARMIETQTPCPRLRGLERHVERVAVPVGADTDARLPLFDPGPLRLPQRVEQYGSQPVAVRISTSYQPIVFLKRSRGQTCRWSFSRR